MRNFQSAWLLGPLLLGVLLLVGCEEFGLSPAEPAASAGKGKPSLASQIGVEKALPKHLANGQEYAFPIGKLIRHGRNAFTAMWTTQDGGGRPLTKGVGAPLSDPTTPLTFPRNFNRLSAPDANSCAGCHNLGGPGGGGDIVANVFVLAHRFDFATFDPDDTVPLRGAVDENGDGVILDELANSRATIGMNGSGYVEMLARQITSDLQGIRDGIGPDESATLTSKGIHFGTLARATDGTWDTSGVEGLPPPAVRSNGPVDPPSLIIHPFHQAGAVVSLRQFTNNAYNHHHGIQSTERFGVGADPDGDGIADELTVADITAVSVFQATMAVPGRVIPRDKKVEQAVLLGEQRFQDVGCADCHMNELPLDNQGWVYSEPNPYNPPGNVQVGEVADLLVDLSDKKLPKPRLKPKNGVVMVPVFTDFKLHDITAGPDDPNVETLNMHFPGGSPEFFAGNSYFLTKKLWGAANEPPYFHHGKYTTMREAILAHAGEAQAATNAFVGLAPSEQDAIIEFLKTLQSLPPGTNSLVVDEKGNKRSWPPK